MKKALICGLSAALLLASLTACGNSQADHQTNEPDPPQAVTSTPAPEPTITPEPAQADAEPLAKKTPVDPKNNEDPQEPVETEAAPEEEAGPVEESQLFTECNETVYATSTVNIRESWNTDSKKLGSLAKGKSITRIGTSIKGTDAEGWSRVKLGDGTIAFISSKYLTTTKSVTQQSSGGSGKTQAAKPAGKGTTQQKPAPSSGGGQSQEDKNKASWEASGQGLAGMDAWAAQNPGDPNFDPASRPGSVVDENGNITNPNVAVNMG